MRGDRLLELARSGRVPWGLVAAALMIASVERFVAHHEDDRFLALQSWTWKHARRDANRRAAEAEILCLGDSMVQGGVAATILEDRLGLRAHVLAVDGGQAPSTYFLVRRALGRAKCRPRAIVVDAYPRLLDLDPWYNRDRWPGLLNLGECLDLAWTSRDPVLLGVLVAARLLPSVRARLAIRDNLGSALAGEEKAHRFHVPPQLRRNLEVNLGGVIMPRAGIDADDLDREARPWACHPVNAAYLRRFLRLASDRDIPVFWLLPPVLPEQQAAFDRGEYGPAHDRFLRAELSRFDNVTVVDGRRAFDDPAFFRDPRHLCREGAIELSERLADALGRHPSAPGSPSARWLHLERSTLLASRVDVEDLERSRVIVRSRRAGAGR